MGAIAGAKLSLAGPVESYVVKTTGAEYDGNVMGSHILLDGRRQGRLYLQGDFIENGLIGHGVREGRRSSRIQNYNRCRGILSDYVSGEDLSVLYTVIHFDETRADRAARPHGGMGVRGGA